MFLPVLKDVYKAMQSKSVVSSDFNTPIAALSELLEIKIATPHSQGGSVWPFCQLVSEVYISLVTTTFIIELI